MNLTDEANKIINEAVFIGLIESSNRFASLRLALKGPRELDLVRSVFAEGRKSLIQQFDKYAKDESLEVLKKENNEYFRLLYRAKFMMEPAR